MALCLATRWGSRAFLALMPSFFERSCRPPMSAPAHQARPLPVTMITLTCTAGTHTTNHKGASSEGNLDTVMEGCDAAAQTKRHILPLPRRGGLDCLERGYRVAKGRGQGRWRRRAHAKLRDTFRTSGSAVAISYPSYHAMARSSAQPFMLPGWGGVCQRCVATRKGKGIRPAVHAARVEWGVLACVLRREGREMGHTCGGVG